MVTALVTDTGSNQRQIQVWEKRGGAINKVTVVFIHYATDEIDQELPVNAVLNFYLSIWHLHHTIN